jgi:F-box protein 9
LPAEPKMAENRNPELEQFREQWRAEVVARSKVTRKEPGPRPRRASLAQPPGSPLYTAIRPPFASQNTPEVETETDGAEDPERKSYHDLDADIAGPSEPSSISRFTREPQSALEHYEKAVERETQGNLGDSLSHYRKAYRVSSPHAPVPLYRCS